MFWMLGLAKMYLKWLLILALLGFILHVKCEYADFVSNIKPHTSSETQQNAAFNVVQRLVGNISDFVDIQVNFQLPQNYFRIFKGKNSDVVSISASSGVAACKGFHYYLKYFCKCHLSWDGYRLENLRNGLPEVDFEMQGSSKVVYYQNVCTHSYSFTWWNKNDWRRHIDWIALSGITLTLAPFQEDIWTEVYRDFGLNDSAIDADLAGPGFFAWQRMGNIRGWGGPLSNSFKNRAVKIQQFMIKELNDLGISVALPAFDGHLPVEFKKLYPQASLSVVEQWNNFPQNYCCPLFLDPTDPLFKIIGVKFLEKVIAKYGTNHIYFADSFNEVQPRLADLIYLANVSKGIFSVISDIDKDAVWLLQGWMFVKNPFWGDDLMEAFLTAVPQGRILVLDLQSEQHPQYVRTKSFYGQPYVWCMLHNFGGTLGMHGSIPTLNSQIENASSMANSTMVGVGITPEGIFQNYVVYEFALEKAWKYKEVNQKKWLKYYAEVRYGIKSTELEMAWMFLLKSVYSFNGLENIRGKYTICRRPSLKISPWKWYDGKFIKKALARFMLDVDNFHLQNNTLFTRDLVDLFRQSLQNIADDLYQAIIEKYRIKDLEGFTKTCNIFLDLLVDLDKLLGTHKDFLLGRYLQQAIDSATNDYERIKYEFNFKNQITLWGPTGQVPDYATKQWNGIVRDYYYPRWHLFFSVLGKCLESNKKFNQSAFQKLVLNQVELPFNYNSSTEYPREPTGDTINTVKELYKKWRTA